MLNDLYNYYTRKNGLRKNMIIFLLISKKRIHKTSEIKNCSQFVSKSKVLFVYHIDLYISANDNYINRNGMFRMMWLHGRWQSSITRFDLRRRKSLRWWPRRRRQRRSLPRPPSRSPNRPRHHRRPTLCCHLFHRLCLLNHLQVTPFKIRSFICS